MADVEAAVGDVASRGGCGRAVVGEEHRPTWHTKEDVGGTDSGLEQGRRCCSFRVVGVAVVGTAVINDIIAAHIRFHFSAALIVGLLHPLSSGKVCSSLTGVPCNSL